MSGPLGCLGPALTTVASEGAQHRFPGTRLPLPKGPADLPGVEGSVWGLPGVPPGHTMSTCRPLLSLVPSPGRVDAASIGQDVVRGELSNRGLGLPLPTCRADTSPSQLSVQQTASAACSMRWVTSATGGVQCLRATAVLEPVLSGSIPGSKRVRKTGCCSFLGYSLLRGGDKGVF